MIHKNVFRKVLVLTFIFLFIGIIFAPSIYGISEICIKNNDISSELIIDTNLIQYTYNNEPSYYAIIAACCEYEDKKYNIIPINKSVIPQENLKLLYHSLINARNWNHDNIILLLNENATKEKIITAFDDISKKIGPEDIFLFSWFGHGSQIPDEDGDESKVDPNDIYDEVICPHDLKEDNGSLINVISDDELDYYFYNINSRGMCLIFECCLSGGFISSYKSIQDKFEKSLKNDLIKNEYDTCDVNGNNRIVIMSTLPDSIMMVYGLTLLLYGSPLIASLADSFSRFASDKNKDGFISAEEAFKVSIPNYIIKQNLYYILYWVSAYITVKTGLWRIVFYRPILKHIYKIPFYKRILERLYNENYPGLSATKLVLILVLQNRLICRLLTGYPVGNWPNINDKFQGDLPIVIL